VFNVTSSGSGTNVLITQNPVICTGQSYTFPDGSIGTTTSSQIDTIPASGSGCDTIITTNLSVVNAISTTINPAICSGQTYTFPDNSTSTIATTYSDTTQLTGGCDSIHTINLTVTLAATFTQTPSICSGQTFTRPGGAIVIAASTYYDTIKVGGCDSIITTILTVNALPNVSGGATQNIPCIPNSIAITASSSTAGANYNWTGPGTITNGTTNNPTVNAAGTYTVTVTDGNGCTNTSTVIVTNNNPLPSATATGTTIPCTQTTDTINANSTTANVTYNWSGPGIVSGGTTNNPTVNAAGTYTVTITDPITGCTNTATATVVVTPSPTASVSADVTIIQGAPTTLTASGSTNYVWTPTTNLNPTTGNTVVASPTITTTYCVEVSDNNGCKDTACVTVTVELPCPENENLDVPNAFSPNKDGVNDEFCLQGWESCIENFSILIYNRWGEKVYESKDPNFCWDGTYRGKELDAQVFVYQLKARFININEPIIKKGNISLIR